MAHYAASIVVGVVAAALYAWGGVRVLRHGRRAGAHIAVHGLTLWWFCIAGLSVLTIGLDGLHAAGVLTLPMAVTLHLGRLVLISAALAGLMYYVTYLLTGRERAWIPILLLYIAYYLLLVVGFLQQQAVAVDGRGWSVGFRSAHEQPPWLDLGLLVLFAAPPLVGAGSLYMAAMRDLPAAQRRRAALVATSILLWTGSSVVLTSSAALGNVPQALGRLVGLAAGVLLIWAYAEPARNGPAHDG